MHRKSQIFFKKCRDQSGAWFSAWRFIFLSLMLQNMMSASATGQSYSWADQYDSTETIIERISPPADYVRLPAAAGSFGHWLRRLPLQPGKSTVYLHNGVEKPNQQIHEAVIDIDVGRRDLQQCADAVMRLRAEYLYASNRRDQIRFNFTSGDRVEYRYWQQGYRPLVRENQITWTRSGITGDNYRNFRKYLTQIFVYAGTHSLSRELNAVENIKDIKIGDLFIQGGFPGHSVLLIDVAQHKETGGKIFLLAQSYMPAQSIHILINPADPEFSPWYHSDFGEVLKTPEWTFSGGDLMRFPEASNN